MQGGPGSDVIDRIAKLAARVADVADVPADKPLALAGLDSLGMAELALAVEDEFGVRLAAADPERLRTIADVSAAVEALRGEPGGPRIEPGIGRLQERARRMLGPVLTGWYHYRAEGVEHVPRSGAAVVSANHGSLLDIPFLALASPRRIWFMAKVELFSGKAASWFFHALGGFSVRRQVADLRAIETALAIVRSGRLLGMFPEGTRSPDELLPFLPGAAWVALTEGVPIVPAAIRGTVESLPRGRVIPKRTEVRVAFGPPIAVEREDDPVRRQARAIEITGGLRAEVARLLA